jgi:hypothetical protein
MAEALAKKKRIRAGHKASATRLLHQSEEVTSATTPDTSNFALIKMSLTEKLETLKVLDSEIAELIDDEGSLSSEIEAADSFKEGIFAAMIKIDKILTPKPTAPPTTSPTPPSRDRTPRSRSSPYQSREATKANYPAVQWRPNILDYILGLFRSSDPQE